MKLKTFHRAATAFGTACLLLATAPAVTAQDQIVLDSDVKVHKTTVDANGVEKTEMVKPEVVVPGDRLTFATLYHNTGAEPATNFVVTNPLHKAVSLASDADPALIVSVDGGKTWGRLANLTVTGEGGTSRAAGHLDVTHIRWTLPVVEPGARGRLEYPAIIR